MLPYVAAQVIGAIAGAAVLYVIASGTSDFSLAKGFAANGYGDHSLGKYGLGAALTAEVVLTMMFVFVIMGATHGSTVAISRGDIAGSNTRLPAGGCDRRRPWRSR